MCVIASSDDVPEMMACLPDEDPWQELILVTRPTYVASSQLEESQVCCYF